MLYCHCSSTSLYTMPLRRSRQVRVGLKLNCTYQLLIYADDVNLMGENIHTKTKNIHASWCNRIVAGYLFNLIYTKLRDCSPHRFNFISPLKQYKHQHNTIRLFLSFTERQLSRDTWSFLLPTIYI